MKLPSRSVMRLNQQMPSHQKTPQTSPVRTRARAIAGVLAVLIVFPGIYGSAIHAQTLPPTPPTSTPSAAPSRNALPPPTAAQPVAAEPSKPHHAEVTYVGGQLNIRANDSSLNQILRSISHRTGLKITGGVADQRVFGNYGPGSTSSVLATLLDGTGTNILLLEGDATNPPELVLTPRNGGATPPGPNSSVYAAYDDSVDASSLSQSAQGNANQNVERQTPAASGPPSIPQPLNNVNGSPSNTSPTASTLPTVHSVPLDSIPTPSTTPSTSGIVDSPNPPPAGSTTGSAPNGTQQPH